MNPLNWIPPAEARLPLSYLVHAFFDRNDDFEKVLCAYLGVETCILGNSGRALMTLLLKALIEKSSHERNEVLIPAYTCYSVAASVAKAGLRITVYDLDPQTLRSDTASLRNAASSRTLAIVYQHLFGIPQPSEDIRDAAERNGIIIIEDAAQGLGGFLNGMPLGSMGDFGIFSFGRGKPLPLGTGGALIGKKKVLEELPILRSTKGYGQIVKGIAMQVFSYPALYYLMEKLPLGLGKTVFDPNFIVAGMPSAVKRLARSSFDKIEAYNMHRRAIADVYKSRLDTAQMVKEPEGSTPVYTRFPFFAGPSSISSRLYRFGVRRMYPRAICDEPAVQNFLARTNQSTPGARQIAESLLTLPTHNQITPSIAHKISELLKVEYSC